MNVRGHRYQLLDDKQSYLDSDEFTLREKVALRYTDVIMWDPTKADDELWAQLHEMFTEQEIVELGFYVGYRCGVQRFIITFHPEHGEYVQFLAEKNKQAQEAELASG